ncbi:MAG: hypothetical protein HY318_17965 [Armatimonadetes bacterium]|nr:hypothetical protein [Armatimonadota bacterium]
MRIEDLDTPTLLVDLDTLEDNLKKMSEVTTGPSLECRTSPWQAADGKGLQPLDGFGVQHGHSFGTICPSRALHDSRKKTSTCKLNRSGRRIALESEV